MAIVNSIPTILILTASCANVFAAEVKGIEPVLLEKFEARVFTESAGHSLNYRLFKPRDYDAHTKYPLVLFLHGAAGLGEDNISQFRGGNEVPPQALTTDEAQARFPSFVLVPQCPRSQVWASAGAQPAERMRLTLATIESLQREFSLDPKRLYVVGVSMGGHGVWDLVTRYPKMFAAAIPICGVGEPTKSSKIANLPVWCFHGAADQTVPVTYARSMIAALRQAGGQPKYTEYPGVGHDSYRNAFREPELLPWLFAQKRKD